jgi:hypothetical protein
MNEPSNNPRFEARELHDGPGWVVLVSGFDRPDMQMGSFATKAQAEEWIDLVRDIWIKDKTKSAK